MLEQIINRCITDDEYKQYVLSVNINANIDYNNALLGCIKHNTYYANINGFEYSRSELQTNIRYNQNVIDRILTL